MPKGLDLDAPRLMDEDDDPGTEDRGRGKRKRPSGRPRPRIRDSRPGERGRGVKRPRIQDPPRRAAEETEETLENNLAEALMAAGGVGGKAVTPEADRDISPRGDNLFGEALQAARSVTSRHPTESEAAYVRAALEALAAQNERGPQAVLGVLVTEAMGDVATGEVGDIQPVFNVAKAIGRVPVAFSTAAVRRAIAEQGGVPLEVLAAAGLLNVWEGRNGRPKSRYMTRLGDLRGAVLPLREAGYEEAANVLDKHVRDVDNRLQTREREGALRKILAKKAAPTEAPTPVSADMSVEDLKKVAEAEGVKTSAKTPGGLVKAIEKAREKAATA